MGISMRPNSGGVPYAPARDLAYLLPAIVKKVAQLFDSRFWPEVVAYVARAQGIPETEAWDQLCDASEAYAAFVNSCAGDENSPSRDIKACFEQSGWSKVPIAAQMGYLAMMGQVLTGQVYHGLRDITPLGSGPSDMVKALNAVMAQTDPARRVLNNSDRGTDLKVELAAMLRTLRDEDVSWETLDRIIAREKALESV